MRVQVVAAVVMVGALAASGCGGGSSSGAENGGTMKRALHGSAPSALNDAAAVPAASGSAGPVGGGSRGASQDASVVLQRLPRTPSTVIKTGQLSIRLKSGSPAATVDEADQIAGPLGGYVLSSDVTNTKPQRATIVMRVPAAAFAKAMLELRGMGNGKVLSEQITGEDVGQEFVDLGARERNLLVQAKALRRLMGQATTVTDTIRVQNQLFEIQGQVEEIQGRLRYLHDQADMSTITVVVSAGAPAHHHHHGHASAIGAAFRRGWDRSVGVVTAVIAAAGLVIPIALLAVAVLFAVWRLWPPVRRRITATASEPEPRASE
jgi:hypothetical protein